MSMLPCRVLCLLAIVLCCVGVAHAAAASGENVGRFDNTEVHEQVEKIKKLKAECEEVGEAARNAAHEAQRFVDTTKKNLKTIAAVPEEVEETKIKGDELSEKAMKAAEKAEELAKRTRESATQIEDIVRLLQGEETFGAREAMIVAYKAADDAFKHAEDATICAYDVKDVLQKLEAAVAAAVEKEEEKQVEPQTQPQEQTNETSLLPTNATITNGTKRNDGSSSPALLRVPLLLLL
ncbi:uncharacterized protein TM35_000023740, partial [Trypanosoma theileri]